MSTPGEIPFSSPFLTGREASYLGEAIESLHLQGDGPFTEKCEVLLAELTGSQTHLLTHSCTGALEMAAILAEVGPGDEVVMPSYTFVSTANAFVLRGATPVFVDIEEATRNIDPALVEAALTPKTKAIVAVNYAGICAPMEKLVELARSRELPLIEDAAQSLGASYAGKPLGSFGDLATFSFHATKNIVSGEGGSLAINNPALLDRAEVIREKGTNRRKFLAGAVDKYTWVDVGSSYLPSELTAAFLLAQLEECGRITKMRVKIWDAYAAGLDEFAQSGRISLMSVPEPCDHNGHLFYLMCRDRTDRDGLLSALRAEGISGTFHYVPLHSSPAGEKFGRVHGSMDVTDRTYECLVRLPLFPGVDAERVLAVTASYLREQA